MEQLDIDFRILLQDASSPAAASGAGQQEVISRPWESRVIDRPTNVQYIYCVCMAILYICAHIAHLTQVIDRPSFHALLAQELPLLVQVSLR